MGLLCTFLNTLSVANQYCIISMRKIFDVFFNDQCVVCSHFALKSLTGVFIYLKSICEISPFVFKGTQISDT